MSGGDKIIQGLNDVLAGKFDVVAADRPLQWQPIKTAPKDGTKILGMDDDGFARVCYPKLFPRPIHGPATAPELWEYFRDDVNAPGHSWSFYPTRWMPVPAPHTEAQP